MRKLLFDLTLFAAAVLLCTAPVWGQGKTTWEWKASDYSGATLYHDGKVIGVMLGQTYFHKHGDGWTQADVPQGAPKPPKHLKPELPPKPKPKPAPDCSTGSCGVGGCGTGSVFHRERHRIIHREGPLADVRPVANVVGFFQTHQPVRTFLRRFGHRWCG